MMKSTGIESKLNSSESVCQKESSQEYFKKRKKKRVSLRSMSGPLEISRERLWAAPQGSPQESWQHSPCEQDSPWDGDGDGDGDQAMLPETEKLTLCTAACLPGGGECADHVDPGVTLPVNGPSLSVNGHADFVQQSWALASWNTAPERWRHSPLVGNTQLPSLQGPWVDPALWHFCQLPSGRPGKRRPATHLCSLTSDSLAAAAAAAAKSLQSCPTLCNPIDGSSPGSCYRPKQCPTKMLES